MLIVTVNHSDMCRLLELNCEDMAQDTKAIIVAAIADAKAAGSEEIVMPLMTVRLVLFSSQNPTEECLPSYERTCEDVASTVREVS